MKTYLNVRSGRMHKCLGLRLRLEDPGLGLKILAFTTSLSLHTTVCVTAS